VRLETHRSLKKSADEVQAGKGYDGQERGSNMAGEGTQRALARVISVSMFPVTMGKGEDTCRDKEQDETERDVKNGFGGPMHGQHEEPVWFAANRVRLQTWEEI